MRISTTVALFLPAAATAAGDSFIRPTRRNAQPEVGAVVKASPASSPTLSAPAATSLAASEGIKYVMLLQRLGSD
jgi:hypothetical protein